MKKHFNKELLMNKGNNEEFKDSIKCCISDDNYIDNEVKVRDHCHITGKYRGSAHIDCNISFILNHKIPDVFHDLKNYDGLEKYMNFTITNKLSFIGSFQFPNSSFI